MKERHPPKDRKIEVKDIIITILLVVVIILLLLGLLGKRCNGSPAKKDPAKPTWVVGGKDGTDVQLSMKEDVVYNTYCGYQTITINKKMKVPFINKETNVSYAEFVITDKSGNEIYRSELIPPGMHTEWNAYDYYNGIKGEYIHDLRVNFYKPVIENDGSISDMIPSMVSPTTKDFTVFIR